VLAITRFSSRPDKAAELRQGLRCWLGAIRRGHGCRSVTLRHCVENAGRFIYVTERAALYDHIVTFRGDPRFVEYRVHINRRFAEPVVVNYYQQVEGKMTRGELPVWMGRSAPTQQ
jgi:hypothetical protein